MVKRISAAGMLLPLATMRAAGGGAEASSGSFRDHRELAVATLARPPLSGDWNSLARPQIDCNDALERQPGP